MGKAAGSTRKAWPPDPAGRRRREVLQAVQAEEDSCCAGSGASGLGSGAAALVMSARGQWETWSRDRGFLSLPEEAWPAYPLATHRSVSSKLKLLNPMGSKQGLG